jgi:hypothetical protein
MWVSKDCRNKLDVAVLAMARAVTEDINAPCVTRKNISIPINAAYALMKKCGVETITLMRFGQKTDFSNKAVRWILTKVRESCFIIIIIIIFQLMLTGASRLLLERS